MNSLHLCFFLLINTYENQPWNSWMKSDGYIVSDTRCCACYRAAPSPVLVEAFLGLTSFLWVYQFSNLSKNMWEFVYLKLSKGFVFTVIYPLPWREQKSRWSPDTWGLWGFTPRSSLSQLAQEGVKARVLSTAGLPVWSSLVTSLTQVLSHCQRNGDKWITVGMARQKRLAWIKKGS